MNNKGRIFVVTGIDGCGKTTVLNALASKGSRVSFWKKILDNEDLEFMWEATRTPGKYREALAPITRTMYIMQPIFAEYEHIVKPIIEGGEDVFIDSYYLRAIAKELIYRKCEKDLLQFFELMEPPSKVFLLKISPNEAYCRKKKISAYECIGSPSTENFELFQNLVFAKLESIATPLNKYIINVSGKCPDSIADEILNIAHEGQNG